MTKWEYLSIEPCDAIERRDLNVAGNLGWELVSVAIIPPSEGILSSFLYVFKRPLPPDIRKESD